MGFSDFISKELFQVSIKSSLERKVIKSLTGQYPTDSPTARSRARERQIALQKNDLPENHLPFANVVLRELRTEECQRHPYI